MKRLAIPCVLITCLLFFAISAGAVKYKKVKSFKDVGQNRAFMIALTEKVPPDKLEDALWESSTSKWKNTVRPPRCGSSFSIVKNTIPKNS